MRIIFFGTPEFAAPYLRALCEHGSVPILAVSQPDRPVGRKAVVGPTPVKRVASEHSIEVLQPEQVNSVSFLDELTKRKPDLCVVVAFGQILSQALLDIPRMGTVNVHPSLLPKYRGAAPLQEAILRGDSETGVTIMLMDEKMDHGPIILQEKIPLSKDETMDSLRIKTTQIGVPLLLRAIDQLEKGEKTPQPQEDSAATYTRLLIRDSGRLDFSKSVEELERQVRALNPWPGTWMFFQKKRLKILKAMLSSITSKNKKQGELFTESDMLFVPCGKKSLQILELQPEGKSPLTAQQFLNGYRKLL